MSLLLFCNLYSPILENYHWSGKIKALPPFYQTVSRCNFRPDIFDYKRIVTSVDEVRNYKTHTYSFADLMDFRSLQLQTTPGKKFVLYSGGIDSTAICVSLLKNWNPANFDDVTILCTPQSYYEYPKFFNVLSENFRIDYCKNNLSPYLQQGHVVTGMQADLLFASNGWISRAYKFGEEFLQKDYKDSMQILFNDMWPGSGELIFNHYHEIVNDHIFEIKTTAEFIYWFYFTQMYQKVALSHMISVNSINNQAENEKLFNFYDHQYFETWSINNLDKAIPYKEQDFKKPLRDYISSYMPDVSYSLKRKFPSYGEVHSGNKFNHGITEDWEFLTFEDSLKYLRS